MICLARDGERLSDQVHAMVDDGLDAVALGCDLAQEWRRVMSVDLDAAFHLTATVGPGVVERRRGRIVHYHACLGRMSRPGTAGRR